MRHIRSILYLFITIATVLACKTPDEVDPIVKEGEISLGDSKPASSYAGTVVADWNNLQLKLIQSTPGYSSPVAARAIGYTNLALYETVVHGLDGYSSLEGKVQGLSNVPKPENGKNYNWALAANAAQYTILRELYGTTSDVMKGRVDTLRRQIEVKLKPGVDEDEIDRSIRYGASVANAIYEFSKKDGGHQAFNNNFTDGYVRKGGAASWQPTSAQKKPLLPTWGSVRSFFSQNAESMASVKVPFSFEQSSPYFLGAKEVYSTVNALNDEQKKIMEFWNDGDQSYTSVGHHLAVLSTIARKEGLLLDDMVLLNTQFALAVNDAAIASMKSKYETDFMRPSTYIRQTIDPRWTSMEKDDSSPEYTSLPATIAGVAAELLANNFGEEYLFEDETYAQALGKRAYKNFTNYGREASLAQLYAGNHMRTSCEEGLANGRKIAQNVMNIKFKNTTDSTNGNM